MSLSRLRLRLGAGFAVAYFVGLLALDLALYGYLRVQSEHRLTRDLQGRAEALIDAVLQEYHDLPAAGLDGAAREAIHEWQAPPGAYSVLDSTGRPYAERGPGPWLTATRPTDLTRAHRNLRVGGEGFVREVTVEHAAAPRFIVTVTASSHGLEEDNETLAWFLGTSAVLILLLGLAGGYLLSRRALAPIDALGDAIAGISPDSLRARLPVNTPADEVDRVRTQFNSLLDRLEGAQAQNRKFLREAAHQIRTPLTLVMGEASLELPRAEGTSAGVLRRIQLAAEQMQRRVDDLFLLAEAQAGAAPPLDEAVDLDGLLLEVADAMRGRAHQLGRQLAFGDVAPLTVAGNRGLLREALLELVENAVRHGSPSGPVELSLRTGAEAVLTVSSGGAPFAIALPPDDPLGVESDHGLGLQIVQWIARLHGGRLELRSDEGRNEVALVLPLGAS
jgi:signal transduction histidine kinase